MLDTPVHKDIKVIGEEVLTESPKLPGLQQDQHGGVCVSVCMSLTWAYKELSGFSFLVYLRPGITQRYQNSG